MSTRSLQTILRSLNISAGVVVDKTGARAQVALPGLSFEDFDRIGQLCVWKLQRTLTAARFMAYHIHNKESGRAFLEYDVMTKDRFTFMASTKTEVTQDFYLIPEKIERPKLAVNIFLGYVGSSSLNSVAQLVDKDSGQVFATNTNTVVAVDKKTRKPTTIPDWWREKYAPLVEGNQRCITQQLEVPSEVHQYDFQVPWSDIDAYKHTNYIAYVKYCFDAGMDGVVNGAFSKFHGDILFYKVKCASALYKKESRAGELLVCSMWENKENPYILHFSISRDTEVLFQNTIEFYEPATS